MLQNLYTLSDEGTGAEAIDSQSFSDFCGVDSSNQVPDGDTQVRFRNLLIRNGIQEKLFAQVTELLQERGLLLKKGTIVDSTLIFAPSSTKNAEKKRDSEVHSTKKGNTWHFGYKAHIGVDKDSFCLRQHRIIVIKEQGSQSRGGNHRKAAEEGCIRAY